MTKNKNSTSSDSSENKKRIKVYDTLLSKLILWSIIINFWSIKFKKNLYQSLKLFKENLNTNKALYKYMFENTLFSLVISPVLFIMFLSLISFKITIDEQHDYLFSGILVIFLIYDSIFLILGIIYISLFKQSLNYNVFFCLIAILTIASCLYTISYIDNVNQKINMTFAMCLFFQSFGTSFVLVECSRKVIKKLYTFIFTNDYIDSTGSIKERLSFINKILLGIITLIGSIVTLILTFQKLFK